MTDWNMRTEDLELKDGSIVNNYHYEFNTTNSVFAKIVEDVLKAVIDIAREKRAEQTEPIPHDDYIESGNDHLEARCLNCNNAKACKEKHWEGCVYEPKDEKTCESCRHWKYIAREWQCEAYKCKGYEPKAEPQTEHDKGLKLFADILFDKDKSNQFLEECKAMGVESQTERSE